MPASCTSGMGKLLHVLVASLTLYTLVLCRWHWGGAAVAGGIL